MLWVMQKRDLIGQRFGRITVVAEAPSRRKPAGQSSTYWRGHCDCGTVIEVQTSHLTSGATRSCGCLQRQTLSALRHKHGDAHGGERLYRIWCGMHSRCRCGPHSRLFKYYSGLGITVAPCWTEYPPFKAWALANGYAKHLTIDRRDGDDGYYPENCRWITLAEQQRNRKSRSKKIAL